MEKKERERERVREGALCRRASGAPFSEGERVKLDNDTNEKVNKKKHVFFDFSTLVCVWILSLTRGKGRGRLGPPPRHSLLKRALFSVSYGACESARVSCEKKKRKKV